MYTYTFVAKYTHTLESTAKYTVGMLLHLTLKTLVGIVAIYK